MGPPRNHLTPRLLDAAWRGLVLGLIFALGLGGCLLGLSCLFGLSVGAWVEAGRSLLLALCAGAAVLWLSTHRHELIEA